jgi:hypothetical protein
MEMRTVAVPLTCIARFLSDRRQVGCSVSAPIEDANRSVWRADSLGYCRARDGPLIRAVSWEGLTGLRSGVMLAARRLRNFSLLLERKPHVREGGQ